MPTTGPPRSGGHYPNDRPTEHGRHEMTTATKTFRLTRVFMGINSGVSRDFLASDGDWTPNPAKARTFDTKIEADAERDAISRAYKGQFGLIVE